MPQDDEQSQNGRSSSAPPTCRDSKLFDAECESQASTRCLTCTCGELVDDISPASEYDRGYTSACSTADEDEDAQCNDMQNSPLSQDQAVVPASVRLEVEALSDKVMDVWSQLRSLEMAASESVGSESPSSSESPAVVWMPVQILPHWALVEVAETQSPTNSICGQTSVRTPLKAPKTDGKASTSGKVFGGVQDFLASVKHFLMLDSEVEDVDVNFTAEGTLASVSVTLDGDGASIGSVISAAKGILLDVAANSQSVYVLGYEAQPFKDVSESTFMTMLASLPITWQRSACWETYQMGACPRGKSCKWQHPGKRELQPVRVSVSQKANHGT